MKNQSDLEKALILVRNDVSEKIEMLYNEGIPEFEKDIDIRCNFLKVVQDLSTAVVQYSFGYRFHVARWKR